MSTAAEAVNVDGASGVNGTNDHLLPPEQQRLLFAARIFYDTQRLRIQCGGRTKNRSTKIDLNEADVRMLGKMEAGLDALEKNFFKDIQPLVKAHPLWEHFLAEVKGVGYTMAAVLLSEIDIRRAKNPSSLWKFAGLDVVDGHAPKRMKGVKLSYNSRLRSKLLGVLAPCMLRADSEYRKYYDDYKNRKLNTMVDVCMGCNGTGIAVFRKLKQGERTTMGKEKCSNCEGGTKRPIPWGQSDGHRHNAAVRYMIKMFLLDLWKEWRGLAGLPIRPSYAEEKLGHAHLAG